MSQSTSPFGEVPDAVPSLRAWWQDSEQDEASVPELCSRLAAELESRIQDGRIAELPALAPIIEKLLTEYDEDDAVSLGLIEPLVWRALDGRLDAAATREALGTRARLVWDSLYFASRKDDIRAVEYEQRDLGSAAKDPATLVAWTVHPRQWVDAGTTIARLTMRKNSAEIRVTQRSWIDRFASPAGFPLEPGTLLLYVAPEALGVPKGARLCELVVRVPAA